MEGELVHWAAPCPGLGQARPTYPVGTESGPILHFLLWKVMGCWTHCSLWVLHSQPSTSRLDADRSPTAGLKHSRNPEGLLS